MNKTRLEAFSDGVLAILITIMVLELKAPHSGTLEALREVCADRAWGSAGFLDALTTLVDVHLVEPDVAPRVPRYRLLPTVADYARERLDDAGESEHLAAHHTGWFAAFAASSAVNVSSLWGIHATITYCTPSAFAVATEPARSCARVS